MKQTTIHDLLSIIAWATAIVEQGAQDDDERAAFLDAASQALTDHNHEEE